MSLIKKRISDKRFLKLIRQWLEPGVIENGECKPTVKGTPQGGVISPLLANIYLHVLDRYWQLECTHLGMLVGYADDFVVMCRHESQAKESLRIIAALLGRLKLALHPDKTKIIRIAEEGFDFLGFHIRKWQNWKSGKLVPACYPSKKAMNNIRKRLRELTSSKRLLVPLEVIVRELNEVIIGWRGYFGVGNGTGQFQKLDKYVRERLRCFFRRRAGDRAKQRKLCERFIEWVATCGIKPFYVPGIFGCGS